MTEDRAASDRRDPPAPRATRVLLLRWLGRFALWNVLFLALVGARYLFYLDIPSAPLPLVYLALSFVGHYAWLAGLPALLVTAPLALVLPSRRVVQPVAVVLASTVLAFIVMDGLVFARNRFHINGLTVALFEWTTWLFAAVILLGVAVFQWFVASSVWRATSRRTPPPTALLITLTLLSCLLSAHTVHAWADATYYAPITRISRYLPLYFPMTAKGTLARLGIVDPERAREQRLGDATRLDAGGDLAYPLKPLDCIDGPGLNLLLILVDSLRPDVVTPGTMPRVSAFSADAVRFTNHFSGGNSSRMGTFSLFYGLPSTYWQAFATSARGPVLVDELLRRDYVLSLHSSSGFARPSHLDRTSFVRAEASISTAVREAPTAEEANVALTNDFLRFLDAREPGHPFFGFLFYDPPTASPTLDEASSWQPELPALPSLSRPVVAARWTKYLKAVHLVDAEVGRVLDGLRDAGLDDTTLVVVSSDHGYELDDGDLGYFGHGSNYTDWQLRVPLAMRWPGRPATVHEHLTSHLDMAPTLLTDLFGCRNDVGDYAVGRHLLAGEPWDHLIAGSYNSHAVIDTSRILVTYPGGFYEILDRDYRPLDDTRLDGPLMQRAVEEMRRFYR